MTKYTKRTVLILLLGSCIIWGISTLGGEQPQTAIQQSFDKNLADVNPALWKDQYPQQYSSWQKTIEPTPTGKSRYKKGYDTDGIIYSRLDEFPYLALLLDGSGYGLEFTEPRGHGYMIHDQLEIDPV
ncbi:MAG: ammonia-forming cytochrome c nitrite reductase subunit c552, partial [Deltaproteobacteria bacterium]|nr:ammonia-forming cytochrome c nitrite reductase subunit c552 [Deltaproteobacteria bacterium]